MSVYYITAKDDLIIRDEVYRLINLPEVSHHYASDLTIDELVDILTVVDMFSFEEGHWIDNVTDIKLLGNNSVRLEKAISDTRPNKRIVFTQNTNFKDWRREKEYRKKAINNLLIANSKYIDKEYETKPEMVARWTESRAKELYGLLLTESNIDLIAESNAYLPQLIDADLRKLSLLKTSEKVQKLSKKLIEENVSNVPSEQLFTFVETLVDRNPDALYLLEDTLSSGAEPTNILSQVFRKLDIIALCLRHDPWSVKEYKELPYFLKKKINRQLNFWNLEQISRAIELTGETDFRLKSLGVDEYDVMASFTREVIRL